MISAGGPNPLDVLGYVRNILGCDVVQGVAYGPPTFGPLAS